MTSQDDKIERFVELHGGPEPLLMPNAWDAGSAKLLASLGFQAIATTSSGFAATLGRLDGQVSREEAIDHAVALAAAVDIPVSADLENGFADEPEGVAATVELARGAGLAGLSVEDYRRDGDEIYEMALSVERVRAAVEAAHAGPAGMVVTARAENHIHGRDDIADTIARLQAFQEAGADVLFAPGVIAPHDLQRLLGEVDRPVSVLALPGGPTVAELADLGVARISVGGAFAHAALAALVDAGRELLDHGTLGFWERSKVGAKAARSAFGR